MNGIDAWFDDVPFDLTNLERREALMTIPFGEPEALGCSNE